MQTKLNSSLPALNWHKCCSLFVLLAAGNLHYVFEVDAVRLPTLTETVYAVVCDLPAHSETGSAVLW